jgi:methylated-DNA-[protein]-cysteine S-methyltransferase
MFGSRVAAASDPLLTAAARQIEEYLAGERVEFDLPTDAAGDDFQLRVWALLAEIPYGETVTYGDLAERCGDRRLARDVGQAVGSNPLSMIVPCHRVVGKDGKLTGYAGGLDRKRSLLELEGALRPEPPAAPGATNLSLWGD